MDFAIADDKHIVHVTGLRLLRIMVAFGLVLLAYHQSNGFDVAIMFGPQLGHAGTGLASSLTLLSLAQALTLILSENFERYVDMAKIARLMQPRRQKGRVQPRRVSSRDIARKDRTPPVTLHETPEDIINIFA